MGKTSGLNDQLVPSTHNYLRDIFMAESEHCGNQSSHHQHLYDDAIGELQYCKGTPYSPLPENVVMSTLRVLYPLLIVLLLRILIERLKRRRH